METQQDRKKRIAPESIKTKRARDKLRRQWEQQDAQITKTALEETVNKIHQWIAANASHRIPLKEKEIRLFDQNQNAALLSRKVQQIAQKLREETVNQT